MTTWTNEDPLPRRIWKLIPVRVEAPRLGPSPELPLYDEDTLRPPAHAQNREFERDEFGTVVTEVTIVTTRKRYRVEGA